jgi:hypothetical protein
MTSHPPQDRSGSNPLQDDLILDACSCISLAASDRIEVILQSVPRIVYLAEYVLNREIKCLHNPATNLDDIPVDLTPCISAGLLTIVTPTEDESLEVFELVDVFKEHKSARKSKATFPEKDSGEVVSGAIAKARKLTLVTDDKDAISILCQPPYNIRVIPTLSLIHHWSEQNKIPHSEMKEVLYRIKVHGRYVPGPDHPFMPWWQKFGP